MTPGIKPVLVGVAIAAAIWGVKGWESSLLARGEQRGADRVQAAWTAEESARSAATARDNATKIRNAERTAHEDAQRAAARAAHDAAAAASVRSLRAEIARLNARPNPYPAGDAGLAACAREASVAREALGESSSAYQSVAAEADRLGDQVIGLLDFVRNTCRAPVPVVPAEEHEGAPID